MVRIEGAVMKVWFDLALTFSQWIGAKGCLDLEILMVSWSLGLLWLAIIDAMARFGLTYCSGVYWLLFKQSENGKNNSRRGGLSSVSLAQRSSSTAYRIAAAALGFLDQTDHVHVGSYLPSWSWISILEVSNIPNEMTSTSHSWAENLPRH
jgi:hypothetical protein